MNTFLSDNEVGLKKDFERFAQDKLAPVASALVNRKQSLTEFLKQLAQAGYLGLNAPAEYGGKNSPFLYVILLAETLAQYEAGVALSLAYHAACIELIKKHGSDEQKKHYLPKLVSGELLGTVAHLQMQGKTLVVLSEISSASSLVLVFVGTRADYIRPYNKESADGDFFFFPDSKIKMTEKDIPIGLKSIYFAEFDSKEIITDKNIPLGESGATATPGNEKLQFARNVIKTILAAAAVGMSQSVLDQTVAYARVGERHGEPMSQSEAIQWKLADLAVESNAARLLTYRAAWSKDEDEKHFTEYAAMCKAYASRVARFHSGEGLQVLTPFMPEIDSSLSRLYTDSKILETFESTIEEEKVLLSEYIAL